VGGHPRLAEFVDALLHGSAGKARLPEVTERLRALAKQKRGKRARSAEDAPDAAQATRQAIAFGARDVLLKDLLHLLTPVERETLLQAAVSRLPLSSDDLAFAVKDGERSADDSVAMAAHLDRLRNLTLVRATDDGVLVEPWLREALAHLQGERRLD